MVTRPFDARELGDYVSKLAPPVPELTVFGMMLGSGKSWHFLRAFKSIESFWYVAKRFDGHLVDVMKVWPRDDTDQRQCAGWSTRQGRHGSERRSGSTLPSRSSSWKVIPLWGPQ